MNPFVRLIPAVPPVYVILRLTCQALPASLRLGAARHRQRVLGAHRAEVTAAKSEYEHALRRALIPRRIVRWLIGDSGRTD